MSVDAKVKILGHALHPILISFPLGLLATAVIFDVLHLSTGTPRWAVVSFWMMVAGVIGGGLAAVPGTVDWLAIPRGTRAFQVGLVHGVGNVIVLLLFGTSLVLRREVPEQPETLALMSSFVGAALIGVTGWLGGELVERHGVSVHEGAALDATSSLAGPSRRAPKRSRP